MWKAFPDTAFYLPFELVTYLTHEKLLFNAHRFFRIRLKAVEKAYNVAAVVREHIPRLLHASDGLIFTSNEAHYTFGTDHKMYLALPRSVYTVDLHDQFEMERAKGELHRSSITVEISTKDRQPS